uniref:Uncharacterized protein n=1 Tax=Salix viminalis TaxID=40686 RepID=A0A6N2NAS5_SALVM
MASVNLYSSSCASSQVATLVCIVCVHSWEESTLPIWDMIILVKNCVLYFKRDGRGRARASLVSGEGDLLSYPNGNGGPDKFVNQSPAIELQPDAIGFGTLSAETTPTNGSFLL